MPRINLWMRSPIFLLRLTRMGDQQHPRSEKRFFGQRSHYRSRSIQVADRVFPFKNIPPLDSLTVPPLILNMRACMSACPRATVALNEFNDGRLDY